MLKYIFLDIDGVIRIPHQLGRRAWSLRFDWACCRRLSWIAKLTGAKVVITSTWKGSLVNGEMTTKGFRTFLMSHGCGWLDVVGWTGNGCPELSRALSVQQWLSANLPLTPVDEGACYVVLDDDDCDFSDHYMPFLKCDPSKGLEPKHVHHALGALGPIPWRERNRGLRNMVARKRAHRTLDGIL